VACFECEEDARRFLPELAERLAAFGLEVEPNKTAVLRFGSEAARQCQQDGLRRPRTFSFLGFTHYVTCSRRGRFQVGRTTDRRRFRKKLKLLNQRLRALRGEGGKAMMDYKPFLYKGRYISGGSISQNYHQMSIAAEWRGKSVTVYVREVSGGRSEFLIKNVNEALGISIISNFDATNRQIMSPFAGMAIQINPTTLDWLEVMPNIHMRDLTDNDDFFRKKLEAVGAPAEAIPSILVALEEDNPATVAVQLAYMKGELSYGEMVERLKSINANHERKLVKLLGAHRLTRFIDAVKSDPVISRYLSTGSLETEDPDHHRKLEEEMLNHNWSRSSGGGSSAIWP
jgi:hypothetical protein